MPKFMRLAFAVVCLAAAVGLAAPPARADITVDVNQGVLQPHADRHPRLRRRA